MILNRVYTQENVTREIRNQLKKTPLLYIPLFLDSLVYKDIEKEIRTRKYTKKEIPTEYAYESIILPKRSKELFTSSIIAQFLTKVTGKHISPSQAVYCFKHKKYTLMHDRIDKKEKTTYEYYFFISPQWNATWGGKRVYVTDYGKGESFSVTPSANSLLIVKREKGTQGFFQYVNHRAKKNAFFVIEGKEK